tara:strand:- start:6339 stop:7448 length:1110 start_codon:yes stop_codon:yes gene_type:complete
MKARIALSSSRASLKLDKEIFLNTNNSISNFENDLEVYYNNKRKVVALNSGTAAIHLALILAGIEKNDLVICQSFTFVASVNPILYLGASPVFIDSEKDTWNMCPLALEESIKELLLNGKKPKAIIVVHLYGMPAKIEELLAISLKYDIKLVEDAAEALGATYKGQKCGTFGDFGIISFNGNKIISTSGGGALVCKTKKEKNKAIFLATQARDEAAHYQHSQLGYNYRMSNILASIGRGQLEVLDDHVRLRRDMHHFYQELFKNSKGITVFTEHSKDYFSNHWLSCIVVDDSITGFTRDDIRIKLSEENIETRPLWKPMHMQPVFNHASYYGNNIAENLFKKGLCLPSGSNLTEKDKNRISTAIKSFLS